jgi:hypothetical protein
VLAFVLLAVAAQEPAEAVKGATLKTGETSYSYRVKGRFERSGESSPGGLLTSRIRHYQSARRGQLVLVKGPEGLWKTPEERLGERVENPAADEADIVRALQEGGPPHDMALELLAMAGKAGAPEDREVDGVMCLRYAIPYAAEPLRASLERQIDRAVQSGSLDKPSEVRWSTMKGGLRAYVDKARGRLVKLVDERSVKVACERDAGPELKTYKTELEVEFSRWGEAKVALPKEVKDRLGIEEE